MKKQVIILYGAPGSGKGTQANLLANKLSVIHVDSGKFLESIVHDPKRQNNAIIKRERKFFDSGKLLTPSFITREIIGTVKKIDRADWGIVFSGSPRTMYEAEHLLPVLERLYGKKNIFIFELSVSGASSIHRNGARLLCKDCGYILLADFYPHVKGVPPCPVCGGKLYKRSLDNPEVIKIRLEEYKERTKPVFAFLRKRGYKVHVIDGRPAPYKIQQKIMKLIK
jgi:adenylate kinase